MVVGEAMLQAVVVPTVFAYDRRELSLLAMLKRATKPGAVIRLIRAALLNVLLHSPVCVLAGLDHHSLLADGADDGVSVYVQGGALVVLRLAMVKAECVLASFAHKGQEIQLLALPEVAVLAQIRNCRA